MEVALDEDDDVAVTLFTFEFVLLLTTTIEGAELEGSDDEAFPDPLPTVVVGDVSETELPPVVGVPDVLVTAGEL